MISKTNQKEVLDLYLELQQFNGTENYFRHTIVHNFYYSDGMRHLAQKAGAYWLIDAIASYYQDGSFRLALKKSERLATLQIWLLKPEGPDARGAKLICVEDIQAAYLQNPVVEQYMSYTDFPFKSDTKGGIETYKPFKLYVGPTYVDEKLGHLLHLPSEY